MHLLSTTKATVVLCALWLVLAGCDLTPVSPSPTPAVPTSASASATIAVEDIPQANATATRATKAAGTEIPSSIVLQATTTSCLPTELGPTLTEPIDEAPVRSSVGQGHVLTGVVRSYPGCSPLANTKIIFWLANPEGKYDDDHRATVYTEQDGTYRFESNFPGQYEGQPPHIHLFASATGYGSVEQEYFPVTGHTIGTFDLVLAAKQP